MTALRTFLSLPRRATVAARLRFPYFAVLAALAAACPPLSGTAAAQTFTSFDQVASSNVPETVLVEVLARRFRSKNYTDLLPLDGGTVGIAHFARGGLVSLYQEMDTQRYFGRTAADMAANHSAKCRPKGRSGNDTGWGCYSKEWWRSGIARFLASSESEGAQRRAWLALMRPAIRDALAHGWTDARSLAIAMGLANSLGARGFRSLAASRGWRPDDTLTAYTGADPHRIRRRDALNEAFPPGL